MAKNQVTLTFAGDDKQLKRTMDDVGDGAERMARRVDHASDSFRSSSFVVDRLKSGLSALATAAVAGAAIVVASAVAIGTESLKAYAEAQTAQLKLEDAYRRFPAIASVNIEAFRKLNEQRMKTTRFDDDASAAAEATLAQYKLTGKQIMTLLPLVQDFAAKTGKDLPAAAEILGNALLGKGRALAEIGFKFKDAGSVTKNYTQLVEVLRKQVGGFAEQEGRTAAGQLEIMKNRLGEVEEAIGAKLMPVVVPLVDRFVELSEIGFEKFEEARDLFNGLGLENLPRLRQAFLDVKDVVEKQFGQSFKDMKQWVIENREEIDTFIGQIASFIKFTGPALGFIIKSTAQNWMITASAIMAVTDAIATLVGWMKELYNWYLKISGIGFATNGQSLGQRKTTAGAAPSTSVMGIPKFHSGGTVPGPPGSEMLAILQAGETVNPPGQGATRLVLELRASGSAAVETAFLEMLLKAASVNGLVLTTSSGRPA